MKRILLGAGFAAEKEDLLKRIFPTELKVKKMAYVPPDGDASPLKYRQEWQEYASRYGADFQFVDITSSNNEAEGEKIAQATILLLTGGNTFLFLHNLRTSGLDAAIKKFVEKREFVLVGFSAGAIVLTPTIKICTLPGFDKNTVNLTDFTGLGIVNFEVFPHFDKVKHAAMFSQYQKATPRLVKPIPDGDCILLEQ